MLGLYHVPARRRDEILVLVRQAAEPGWVQVHGRKLPEQWQALIEWEDKATTLKNFEPLGIPGLLQTADRCSRGSMSCSMSRRCTLPQVVRAC
jgi:hypothetical protein